MKIYTKSGDKGMTGRYLGPRVPKHHLSLQAYGTVDELNSWIGFCRAELVNSPLLPKLERIQSELFDVGADLSTPWRGLSAQKKKKAPRVSGDATLLLETEIDEVDATLPPLTSFILPGGSRGAAAIHIARTICRRAERYASLLLSKRSCNPEIIVYLNRLSDWLFVMARAETQRNGVAETLWRTTRRDHK